MPNDLNSKDAIENTVHDVIIIGGGPAGFSAALYAARASLDTLVIEQGMPGGQIATSDMVDNYPGIPSIPGFELGQRIQEHAEAAGVAVDYDSVQTVTPLENGRFEVGTDSKYLLSRSVIVATGATPRKAGFRGEDALRGRGVSYCATCDGMFYKGKHVFVIGGGNTACEGALYLSHIAERVELVVRRDQFRASRGMVERVLAQENITVRYLTSIMTVEGERAISCITFRDNKTGEEHSEHFDEGSVGVFVATGHDPATELVRSYVNLGSDGGVLTDEAMATRTPGLYCAGDMRSKTVRQVVTAAADGAIAAMSAYKYVEEQAK